MTMKISQVSHVCRSNRSTFLLGYLEKENRKKMRTPKIFVSIDPTSIWKLFCGLYCNTCRYCVRRVEQKPARGRLPHVKVWLSPRTAQHSYVLRHPLPWINRVAEGLCGSGGIAVFVPLPLRLSYLQASAESTKCRRLNFADFTSRLWNFARKVPGASWLSGMNISVFTLTDLAKQISGSHSGTCFCWTSLIFELSLWFGSHVTSKTTLPKYL